MGFGESLYLPTAVVQFLLPSVLQELLLSLHPLLFSQLLFEALVQSRLLELRLVLMLNLFGRRRDRGPTHSTRVELPQVSLELS